MPDIEPTAYSHGVSLRLITGGAPLPASGRVPRGGCLACVGFFGSDGKEQVVVRPSACLRLKGRWLLKVSGLPFFLPSVGPRRTTKFVGQRSRVSARFVLADRKKGKVWEFLWREVQLDGSIRRKHIVIGRQDQFPTGSAAQGARDAIGLEVSQPTPIRNISCETSPQKRERRAIWSA